MTRRIVDRNPTADFPAAVLFLSIASASSPTSSSGEPLAIQAQREAGHHKASALGVGVVKEFIEIGAPATSLRQRPTLRAMLDYLTTHPEVRTALFPSPGRFARSLAHTQQLLDTFESLSVAVIFSRDGDDQRIGWGNDRRKALDRSLSPIAPTGGTRP
ncbi:recombinase family protein [Nocardia sp. NPDC003482]